MKRVYIFALSLLALPALANNEKGFYAGAGVTLVNNHDHDDFAQFDANASVNAKNMRANEIFGGYKYNDYLGAEVRYGSGTDAAKGNLYSANVKTGEVTAELGSYKSIYYRPEMVNDEAKLYGLIGYTQLDVTVANNDATGKELSSANTSYSGFSYGVGIGFVIADHFNINVEYKNICRELYDNPNTTTINIDYRF